MSDETKQDVHDDDESLADIVRQTGTLVDELVGTIVEGPGIDHERATRARGVLRSGFRTLAEAVSEQ
ncbi:hypothetical protein [Algiphilus sp.]|uniref:hypothetical protein n=1 Tax=Algiphilus sp. TaxID=1872431 RepID=UPI0025C535FE|nr:hypothetical protein [Algiphilus sp.]MCK5772011.1 hypothetical protein [Algiphilus sp.]